MGGGLSYNQQINTFKWGASLESPSYRGSYKREAFLSLQGEWIFQMQSRWMASLGVKLSGKIFPIKNMKSLMFYISPVVSFEYFFDDAFSFFVGLHFPVDPFDPIGIIRMPEWIVFEIPVGVSFYF